MFLIVSYTCVILLSSYSSPPPSAVSYCLSPTHPQSLGSCFHFICTPIVFYTNTHTYTHLHAHTLVGRASFPKERAVTARWSPQPMGHSSRVPGRAVGNYRLGQILISDKQLLPLEPLVLVLRGSKPGLVSNWA